MALLFLAYCLPLLIIYFALGVMFSQIRMGEIEKGSGNSFHISKDMIHADYVFDSRDFEDMFGRRAKFVKIGWGDRKIFLETKTWGELKIESVISAFLGLNGTVLRVEFLEEIPENSKKVEASDRQIEVLRRHVRGSFSGNQIEKRKDCNQNGEFYESHLRYNCITNCNNWVNRGMFMARLTDRVWCPFSLWI